MFAEAVDGIPGYEPFATFLPSFQCAFLDERQDPQMGRAELFGSCHYRYGFFLNNLIFHFQIPHCSCCSAKSRSPIFNCLKHVVGKFSSVESLSTYVPTWRAENAKLSDQQGQGIPGCLGTEDREI
jgi:hypothetical protein